MAKQRDTQNPCFSLDVFSHTSIMQETLPCGLSGCPWDPGAQGNSTVVWPSVCSQPAGKTVGKTRSSLCQFLSSKPLGSSQTWPSLHQWELCSSCCSSPDQVILTPSSLRCHTHSCSKSSQVPTTTTASTTTTRLKASTSQLDREMLPDWPPSFCPGLPARSSQPNSQNDPVKKLYCSGTSLVVQWLRIWHPVQGRRVWSPVKGN